MGGKEYKYDGLDSEGGAKIIELTTVQRQIGDGRTEPQTYGIARYTIPADTLVK